MGTSSRSRSAYGNAPMWSSCACVMRNPRILFFRWRRYVMSGITRSIPSIPSSGNIRPASTTTMSSPTSIASMFLPISPTPPRGITRSDAPDLAKERCLLHRLFLRLFRGRGGREEEGQGSEVGVERVAQCRLMQRRGRVVHGEDQQAVGGLARFAVDPRYRLARKELPHRVAAQGDDHARPQDLEVPEEPHVARRYLFW